MQVWNVLHAACWKCRTQKISKNLPSGHHRNDRTTLLGYIFATKAHIDNRKKNLLNSNVTPTCPHNMVNFGPLAAEICWRVWGTPANFISMGFASWQRYCIWQSSSGRQPNFAALNRGRHLYSAGRPLRWSLAHIFSFQIFCWMEFSNNCYVVKHFNIAGMV